MISRSVVPFFLFFFLCILLGAFLGVGGLKDDRVSSRLAEKYLGVKDIGNYKELSSVLPEKLAVFVYTADRRLATFGALGGLGILLAWLTIRLVTRMSGEKAGEAALVKSWSLNEAIGGVLRRSPSVLVKITATLAGTTILIGLCVYWLGISWFTIVR